MKESEAIRQQDVLGEHSEAYKKRLQRIWMLQDLIGQIDEERRKCASGPSSTSHHSNLSKQSALSKRI